MTMGYAKNFVGPWPPAPPGYAYGATQQTICAVDE